MVAAEEKNPKERKPCFTWHCPSCRFCKKAAFFLSMNWSAVCIRRLPSKSSASSTIRLPIPRMPRLIFTTHDTNLLGNTLGEPALRRDQVWLTEKDAEGATVLYPLTDYKPRKAENLRARLSPRPLRRDSLPWRFLGGGGVSTIWPTPATVDRRQGRRPPFRDPKPTILVVTEGRKPNRNTFTAS